MNDVEHNNNNSNNNNNSSNDNNSNDNNSNDNNSNDNNSNDNIEMNHVDGWRLRTLYTDTKYVCAAKTDEVLTSEKLYALQNRPQFHPSSVPVILKDATRPYTYYTMKSYGHAQDNNYYVNFDDHVNASGGGGTAAPGHYNNNINNNNNSNNSNIFETEYKRKESFDDSGCVKTYLCSILGCFVCCLFQLKPV
jgi:hypothetical protein